MAQTQTDTGTAGRTAGGIIDVDIHPVLDPMRVAARMPQPWRRRFESGNRGPGGPGGYWNPNGVRRSDAVLEDGEEIANHPRSLIERFLEPHGIAGCVLTLDGTSFTMSPEREFSAAAVSAANDVLAEEWLETDRRFRASLLVSPTDPRLAAAEVRRLGSHPGFVQVLLPSGSPMSFGHRWYDPIYEAASELGLPIAAHPGTEGVGISGAPTRSGWPANYLEWHTGLVMSYMGHLISLITEGTFQKFPSLRFVMIEAGVCWLPPLLWRFDKNWKALRQLSPWLERPPSEVAREHVLVTTQPLEEPERREHLHQMLAMLDAERMLMFSSDFPHWDGDEPDFAGSALPVGLRERVLAGTARELYGFDR